MAVARVAVDHLRLRRTPDRAPLLHSLSVALVVLGVYGLLERRRQAQDAHDTLAAAIGPGAIFRRFSIVATALGSHL